MNTNQHSNVSIQPRHGAAGWLDRLTGPGATPAEIRLQFLPSVLAAILAPAYAVAMDVDFSVLQLALISFLAFDLLGGVLTNSTAAAKRWFHRPGQGPRQHLGFVTIHLLHIAAVAALFRDGDFVYFAVTGSFLLLAASVIIASPLYLQRTVSLGLFALSIVGSAYLFSPTPGLEWFLPLFFLKLLVSHLVFETPFRQGD